MKRCLFSKASLKKSKTSDQRVLSEVFKITCTIKYQASRPGIGAESPQRGTSEDL